MKTFIFVCFLSMAAARDVRELKIPNSMLKWMLLIGLLCNAISCSLVLDLWNLIKVCSCSFLIGSLFYRMRVLGAGDVKLMTICGLYVSGSSMLVMWYVALLVTGIGGSVCIYTEGKLTRRILVACSYLRDMIEQKKVMPYAHGIDSIGTSSRNVFPFGYSVLIAVLCLLLVKGEV